MMDIKTKLFIHVQFLRIISHMKTSGSVKLPIRPKSPPKQPSCGCAVQPGGFARLMFAIASGCLPQCMPLVAHLAAKSNVGSKVGSLSHFRWGNQERGFSPAPLAGHRAVCHIRCFSWRRTGRDIKYRGQVGYKQNGDG
jgi:hypothetical protein